MIEIAKATGTEFAHSMAVVEKDREMGEATLEWVQDRR